MRRVFFLSLAFLCTIGVLLSQTAEVADLERGAHFIETKVFSQQENAEILEQYKNLRVADVSDGMDMVGLPNTGLVDPAIHPDWTDKKTLAHVFRGIAITTRYVPTQMSDRPDSGEDFSEWETHTYGTVTSGIYSNLIKPGHVLVIDDVEDKDIGSIGSSNILGWFQKGLVGVVTDAGARDTDEIEIQKIPLYCRKKGRGIRPGRNVLESVNRPVVIGGVLVCPGDVVVADKDGVIVVPRAVARQVALYAAKILNSDKAGRRKLYESLGMPLDRTVK